MLRKSSYDIHITTSKAQPCSPQTHVDITKRSCVYIYNVGNIGLYENSGLEHHVP